MSRKTQQDVPFVDAIRKTGGTYLGDINVVHDLLAGLASRSVKRWSGRGSSAASDNAAVQKEDEDDITHTAQILLGQNSHFNPVSGWNQPGGIDGWIRAQNPKIKSSSPLETVEIALHLFMTDVWSVVSEWDAPASDTEQHQEALGMVAHQWVAMFLGFDESLPNEDSQPATPVEPKKKSLRKTILGLSLADSPADGLLRPKRIGRIVTARSIKCYRDLEEFARPALGKTLVRHDCRRKAHAELASQYGLRLEGRPYLSARHTLHDPASRVGGGKSGQGANGFVVFDAAGLRGDDVDSGESRELRIRTNVPAERVVKVVRPVFFNGKAVMEDALAAAAVNSQGSIPEEMTGLPAKYNSWFFLQKPYSKTKTWSHKTDVPRVLATGKHGIEHVAAKFTNIDDDDEHVYHVTTADRAKRILKHGFKVDASRSMSPGFYQQYSRGKVFFADRKGVSFWQARVGEHLQHQSDDFEEPELAVLRVRKDKIDNLKPDELGSRDSYAGSYFTEGTPRVRKSFSGSGHAEHRTWLMLPASADHAYHATSMENAFGIADEGLLTHKPWHGTDQQSWPDGTTEKRSYFAHSPAEAYSFAPEHGRPVLLRIRRDAANLLRESNGDLYSKVKLPAHLFEVAMGNGTWVPLASKQQGARKKTLGGEPPAAAVPVPSIFYQNPDTAKASDKKKAKTELLKQFETDERSRDIANTLAHFTQGGFKQVREIAEMQHAGTFADHVAAKRAERVNRIEKAIAEGTADKLVKGHDEDFSPIWSGWADVKTVHGKLLDSMDAEHANRAVAHLQQAIADSPVHEMQVHRGAAWHYQDDELQKQIEDGHHDTWNPPKEDDGSVSPGWTKMTVNKYGFDDEVWRPDKSLFKNYIAPHFEVGKEFDLVGPTSFTRDHQVADDFAWHNDIGQRGRGSNRKRQSPSEAPFWHRYVFTVEGGVKGLHADAASTWKKQKEFVTNGRFRVTGMESKRVGKSLVHHVKLQQVGVFGGKPATLGPIPQPLRPFGTTYNEIKDE